MTSARRQRRLLIAVVGPTGTGKSSLAIYLAGLFAGEIVNADSRQVYRYMNIGTAKPSPGDLTAVPHHLFDIANPDEDFSLAEYLKLARKTVKDIHGRGKLPFLVGGSGQYIRALLEGWQVPRVAADAAYRKGLEKAASEKGPDILYQRLVEADPAAAAGIDRRNIRRVIRALEVIQQSGSPFSKARVKKEPGYDTLAIGLTATRAELYRRVDDRVDRMFAAGLTDEVERLVKMGYGPELPSMSSIGYKQIGMYRKGQIDLEEAVRLIKFDTHRFIRHQYAWFRLNDRSIYWFGIEGKFEHEVTTLVGNFLDSVRGGFT